MHRRPRRMGRRPRRTGRRPAHFRHRRSRRQGFPREADASRAASRPGYERFAAAESLLGRSEKVGSCTGSPLQAAGETTSGSARCENKSDDVMKRDPQVGLLRPKRGCLERSRSIPRCADLHKKVVRGSNTVNCSHQSTRRLRRTRRAGRLAVTSPRKPRLLIRCAALPARAVHSRSMPGAPQSAVGWREASHQPT